MKSAFLAVRGSLAPLGGRRKRSSAPAQRVPIASPTRFPDGKRRRARADHHHNAPGAPCPRLRRPCEVSKSNIHNGSLPLRRKRTIRQRHGKKLTGTKRGVVADASRFGFARVRRWRRRQTSSLPDRRGRERSPQAKRKSRYHSCLGSNLALALRSQKGVAPSNAGTRVPCPTDSTRMSQSPA
jgi:hypothetical protein